MPSNGDGFCWFGRLEIQMVGSRNTGMIDPVVCSIVRLDGGWISKVARALFGRFFSPHFFVLFCRPLCVGSAGTICLESGRSGVVDCQASKTRVRGAGTSNTHGSHAKSLSGRSSSRWVGTVCGGLRVGRGGRARTPVREGSGTSIMDNNWSVAVVAVHRGSP